MPNAHKCPKCGGYIFGEYCFICQINVRNYLLENNDIPNVFKDIFGDVSKLGDTNE